MSNTSSMIADAIETIQETTIAAADARVLAIDGEERLVYIKHGGNLVKHEFDRPAPRSHTAHSLFDLVTAAMYARAQMEKTAQDRRLDDLSIWHSQGCVKAMLGDWMRRESVVLQLIVSPVFAKLKEIEKGVSLPQKDFLRLLKHDFDKAGDFGSLAAAATRVKFSSSSETNASIQIGRESLGRAIQLEAVGAADFPEEFEVTYPVYVNPGLSNITATVRCTLDINIPHEKFIVQPKPDELLAAYQYVHAEIHQQLTEFVEGCSRPLGGAATGDAPPAAKYGCQVFYGTP